MALHAKGSEDIERSTVSAQGLYHLKNACGFHSLAAPDIVMQLQDFKLMYFYLWKSLHNFVVGYILLR